MPTLRQRSQGVEPGARIELFDADLTAIGGPILYFHNEPTVADASLFWQTHEYEPYPIKVENMEYKSTGSLPRPHLFLSNVGSTISALLRAYGDCIGAKITRHVTYLEFLDDQPGADPTQEFPPDVFYVNQRIAETNLEVEFELVSAVDVENIELPRRQIVATLCTWVFRGTECGYSGPPLTDLKGNPVTATTDRGAYNAATTYALHDYTYVLVGSIRIYYVSLANGNTAPLADATKWVRTGCSKRLTSGCKVHFGATNPLPFGGFPGTARLPASTG